MKYTLKILGKDQYKISTYKKVLEKNYIHKYKLINGKKALSKKIK